MEYKKYRVSKTLKESVENVLGRRGIEHQFVEADGEIYCLLQISNNKFHKVVVRAKMEKYGEERGSSIPYLAKEEQGDFEVLDEISETSCMYSIYDESNVL
ncbi:MAG: hypothetical protein R3Y47_01235 [Lachnospiraceae bacterium]